MASTEEKNTESAKRFVQLYNETPNWIEETHAKDHEWEELPTKYSPEGYKGGFEDQKERALQISQLLPDRKMEILNLVAGGDQVVLDIAWKGTLSMTVDESFKEGDIVESRFALFLKFRDGKIIKETDFVVAI